MSALKPVLLCLAAVLVFTVAEVVYFATGPTEATPTLPPAPVALVVSR